VARNLGRAISLMVTWTIISVKASATMLDTRIRMMPGTVS